MNQCRYVSLGVASMLFTVVLTVGLPPSVLAAQAVLRVGTEFQVNTHTTNSQVSGRGSVAAAGNGDFVVVWSSDYQDGARWGVFGQRYASNGSPLGTEFQVNTYTTNYQHSGSVAAAANGDFVVVWTSYTQDGFGDGVFGQRYASSGGPLGTEFQVNTYTTSGQTAYFRSVAAAGTGDFIVVWEGFGQDGSGLGVFGQRYASSGNPLGTEFRVNTYTTNDQSHVTVSAAGNGDFVVVWRSKDQDGSGWGVFGQRYASSGNPLGTEFQVNTYTTNTQDSGSVAAATNGDFVVVWGSYFGSVGYGRVVLGQRYASSGNALGTEFQINSYTTANARVTVTAADNGDFVVVWESDQDGSEVGIFGQRYASSGSPLSTRFQVNTYTTNVQIVPAVAAAGNEGFVVVWSSDVSQDGSGWGVFGQRYGVVECAPTPLGGCALPQKSLLAIKDNGPAGASAGDKLMWKWLNGPPPAQADFGDPTTTGHYKLCIYSGTAQTLAMEAVAPQGSNWQELGDYGYRYKDKSAGAAGITRIVLKGAPAAKIQLKGKDGQLDLTPGTLPLDGFADVIVQLSNTDNSNCWQAAFPTASVRTNIEVRFRAKTP